MALVAKHTLGVDKVTVEAWVQIPPRCAGNIPMKESCGNSEVPGVVHQTKGRGGKGGYLRLSASNLGWWNRLATQPWETRTNWPTYLGWWNRLTDIPGVVTERRGGMEERRTCERMRRNKEKINFFFANNKSQPHSNLQQRGGVSNPDLLHQV